MYIDLLREHVAALKEEAGLCRDEDIEDVPELNESIAYAIELLLPEVHDPPDVCWCVDDPLSIYIPWYYSPLTSRQHGMWKKRRRMGKKQGFCDECHAELTNRGEAIRNADTRRIEKIIEWCTGHNIPSCAIAPVQFETHRNCTRFALSHLRIKIQEEGKKWHDSIREAVDAETNRSSVKLLSDTEETQ